MAKIIEHYEQEDGSWLTPYSMELWEHILGEGEDECIVHVIEYLDGTIIRDLKTNPRHINCRCQIEEAA